MSVYELNLDGMVGPTHHYAGLAFGNLASIHNAGLKANPRDAALQGLKKMRFLCELGIPQAVLPPHCRPNLALLHQLGFQGNAQAQIQKAYKTAPQLLSIAFSASSMWAANMATVSASADAANHKVNFTAANLLSNLHRQQETDFSHALLKKIFSNEQFFCHHSPLPASLLTSDEGAANHNRLCKTHAHPGLSLFVYGKEGALFTGPRPLKYPARQSLEASAAIARMQGLDPERTLFARQNAEAIDQGVFHNDVIAVVNESVFFLHEKAFYQQNKVYAELYKKADFELHLVEIKQKELSLQEAVQSYLFNSQLVSLADGSMLLLAPKECEDLSRVKSLIDAILSDKKNPIQKVHYFDLKQSMQNGGGPACLRLRVPLKDRELRAMHQGLVLNASLLETLENWVIKHYRNELAFKDLADPALLEESFRALDELTEILGLGSIYPFQKERST